MAKYAKQAEIDPKTGKAKRKKGYMYFVKVKGNTATLMETKMKRGKK